MSTDLKTYLALAAALAQIHVTDDNLDEYDAFARHSTDLGVTFLNGAQSFDRPLTYSVLTVYLIDMLSQWGEAAATHALLLPTGSDLDAVLAPSPLPERDVVMSATAAIQNFGHLHFGLMDAEQEMGAALAELAPIVLALPDVPFDAVIRISNAAFSLLKNHDPKMAHSAHIMAYRLLVHPTQLPFLPDMPMAKFPPVELPRFEGNTMLAIARRFITDGVIHQSFDLTAALQEMRDDPEISIKNDLYVEIDGAMQHLKVDVVIAPELIDIVLRNDPRLGVSAPPDIVMKTLLQLIAQEDTILDSLRDDDLGHIFQVAHLGANPDHDRLELTMKIENVRDIVRIHVGTSLESVRTNSIRDYGPARIADNVLDHIRAAIQPCPPTMH